MISPCDFLEARTSLFMVVYVLFCIFLLLLTEIECFLCMFAGNLGSLFIWEYPMRSYGNRV